MVGGKPTVGASVPGGVPANGFADRKPSVVALRRLVAVPTWISTHSLKTNGGTSQSMTRRYRRSPIEVVPMFWIVTTTS